MTNPNDEIRQKILQYFYDRNSAAISKHGKKGSAIKISDIKKECKAKYSLTQQEVVSNLTYLIDMGWINSFDVEKTVRVKGGTVPSTVTWYEISAKGIDKIEGESEFQVKERYPGINITAMGSNVITTGDGNIVNVEFSDLHEKLDLLKKEISENALLNDTQKLDASVDIESIKDQLAKPNPNKNIVGTLWENVKNIATVAGLVKTIAEIGKLITILLP